MPRCYSCGTKYKESEYNTSGKCDECYDVDWLYIDDAQVELDLLVNPSGRTKPVFYDEEPEQE